LSVGSNTFQKTGAGIVNKGLITFLLGSIAFGGSNSCPSPNSTPGSCAVVESSFNNFNLTLTTSSGASGLTYLAGDRGTLYTITPTTGAITTIGTMSLTAGGAAITMGDIAMYNGALYGLSFTGGNSTLYSINTSTGIATAIGDTGQALNAATFSSSG